MGTLTLASRAFGLIREILMARYLGNGILSDAFWTAFKVPNMLRKIFAEGALTAAFVPTIVHTIRHGSKEEANSLMTLAFIIFEGFVLAICLGFMLFAKPIIYCLAPGFSPEQITATVPLLILLMPFIFFISGGALLAGTLQAVHHFFIPAIAPIFLNFVFIIGALLGIMYQLPTTILCFFILSGGLIQFIAHLMAYKRFEFGFGSITSKALRTFGSIFIKFLVCVPSMSLAEISLFIDTQFASYVIGGVSSITYANRFMGIPLGVFATSFAAILLPHFSRISSYAPKRLSYYLLESTKLILWVTTPVMLGMIFFAQSLFITLFTSDKFPIEQALKTGNVLIISVLGLFFFSLNKIILNIFYAQHKTALPTIIALLSTGANIALNFMLMPVFGILGLAFATTSAAIIQTLLSLIFLRFSLRFTFYSKNFFSFFYRYCMQLGTIGCLFLASYYALHTSIVLTCSPAINNFLLNQAGFWIWTAPLSCATFAALYYSRSFFGVKLYFLD